MCDYRFSCSSSIALFDLYLLCNFPVKHAYQRVRPKNLNHFLEGITCVKLVLKNELGKKKEFNQKEFAW